MSKIEDKEYRRSIYLKVKNDYGIELSEDDVSLCIIEQEKKRVSIFHNQIYPNQRSRKVGRGYDAPRQDFISWDLTIDGARAIAHRHGLCGIDKPVFKILGDLPDEVEVTVYRRGPRGERYPFTGAVRYDEFVQKVKYDGKWQPNRMWKNSPFNQLAKCAEAQALRKGFQEIGDDDPFLVELDESPAVSQEEVLAELTRVGQGSGGYQELENPLVKDSDEAGGDEEGTDVVPAKRPLSASKSDSPPAESVPKVKRYMAGEEYSGLKIMSASTDNEHIQHLVLEDETKVLIYPDGKVHIQPNVPGLPNFGPGDGVEALRMKAKPLLKKWCETKNNGEKISYKRAYENLVGVVMGGPMTENDYVVLIDQLTEALGAEV